MRRALTVVALAATALGGAAFAVDRATSSAPDPAMATVGATGSRLTLGERASTVLAGINATRQAGLEPYAERIATRGTRTFYRLAGGREDCYGVKTGPPGDRLPDLGILLCSPNFPSVEEPLLSLSVVEATAEDPQLRLIKVQGIAANGVAEVGVLDAAGDVVLRVPVRDNAFSADQLPAGELTGLVAFDEAGARVYAESVR